MAKEHTVTKLRLLLQEADASNSEMKSLHQYLHDNTSKTWGTLYLADGGYFALLQKPTAPLVEKIDALLKARGFSFKRVTGRGALDILRKVAASQTTGMDRRLLKTLHARAAEHKLYKISRSG